MFASLPLIYLAGLGVLLASIYLAGLSSDPKG